MRKKLTKIFIWLVLTTIVAGFFSVVAPRSAQATDQTRFPTGDISAAGTWSVYPTSPTTKWDKVDETPHDSDSTYLLHGTTAGNALFSFSAFSIPAGSTISDLTVTLVARDNTSGTNKMQPAITVNGTNYLTTSTSTNVATSYGPISYAYTTNPDTGAAWTVDDINGIGSNTLQGFGVRSADANPQIRVTQVFAEVNYTTMTVATDKSSYETSGETISATGTVYNNTTGNLTNTVIDYVVFIDANSDGQPDAGETYVTSGCAGSDTWASGNYTFQKTGLNINADSNATDQQSCTNSNFPSNTTYTLWSKWYDGGSTTYAINYVTFTSVPTLGEILFVVLLVMILFFVIRLIWLFKQKRHWLFYYLSASFSLTLAIIFFTRHFGIDQFLVESASFHVHLFVEKLFSIPIELLSNGRLQVLLADGGNSILKLGIECSAVIESSILISLMLFFPLFSLRQRLLRMFFGLVATYLINIIRLMIIVLMTYKFGPDYIFIAHAGVGRMFFFVAELILYWFLFTKPMVKSVGDSIVKKIPVNVTARSGKSLQWRYTYAQVAISLTIASVLAICFGLTNDWQKAFISQKPVENVPAILGEVNQPVEKITTNDLAPGNSAIYSFGFAQSKSLNLKIAEGRNPIMIEVYLNDKFQNRAIILKKTNDSIIETSVFQKTLDVFPEDVIKIKVTNLGEESSSYLLYLFE